MIRDMTEGRPAGLMVRFALPMILGNLLQQLYNVVDLVVVGRFVGPSALAAVGASGSATFLLVALATGASAGCTVAISQLFGAKRMEEMKGAVYTSLLAMAGAGTLVSAAGLLLGPGLLGLMGTPPELQSAALDYLRIYVLAVLFLFVYNAVTAAFNALGDSKTPLLLLLGTSLCNVGLDLLFVRGFGWGVAGAAWATLISQALSAAVGLGILLLRLRRVKTGGKIRPFSAELLGHIARLALPSMLQQSIVSLGFLCVQSVVNGYGEALMAGYTAATKIDNLALLPMMNIGNAVAAYTAQNTGAGKPERVRQGLKAAHFMSALIACGLSAALLVAGRFALGLFVEADAGAAVIQAGMGYLGRVAPFYLVMGLMSNLWGVLRGRGQMGLFLLSTLLNFGVRIGGAYLLSALWGAEGIWWSLPLGWLVGLVTAGLFCLGKKRQAAAE